MSASPRAGCAQSDFLLVPRGHLLSSFLVPGHEGRGFSLPWTQSLSHLGQKRCPRHRPLCPWRSRVSGVWGEVSRVRGFQPVYPLPRRFLLNLVGKADSGERRWHGLPRGWYAVRASDTGCGGADRLPRVSLERGRLPCLCKRMAASRGAGQEGVRAWGRLSSVDQPNGRSHGDLYQSDTMASTSSPWSWCLRARRVSSPPAPESQSCVWAKRPAWRVLLFLAGPSRGLCAAWCPDATDGCGLSVCLSRLEGVLGGAVDPGHC